MHITEITTALLINDISHFIENVDTLQTKDILKVLEHMKVTHDYMTQRARPRPPANEVEFIWATIKFLESKINGKSIE